ncbi:MAG: DUF4238 domain-containing protein [Luteolibacter sp.]|uniref:DUF4238 domain-containing protein n=1 Tax=Luteolibacter sp. TaxID=1962973 RepID=UPI003267AE92
MKRNRKTERHHYVPQFYLRHWHNERKKLWVHPINGNEFYQSGSHSVAFEKGLYATETLQDLQAFDQEADLGKLEALFAPRWSDLFENIADPRRKKNIARYLSIQHLRHPSRLEENKKRNFAMLELLSRAPEAQEKIEIQTLDGITSIVRIKDYRDFLQDPSQNHSIFIWGMRSLTEELSEILFQRRWGIVESPSPFFVTSDSPLKLWRGGAKSPTFGFRTPGTEIFFPITPQKLLVISDAWPHDSSHISQKDFPAFARMTPIPFNVPQIQAAKRFVFSATPLIPGII